MSINWCPSLIQAALLSPVMAQMTASSLTTNTPPDMSDFKIWSNRVDSHGSVSLLVPGAQAKKDRIVALQQQSSSPSAMVVYVGDSSTDLTALIQADVGIFIGDPQSSALSMAQQWGISVQPLSSRWSSEGNSGASEKRRDKDDENQKILWQTTSWLEIGRLLQELNGSTMTQPTQQ
uniref:Uncharacterized protein n=1 Tax=Entomoneis paludosa TaxID=265537 RepID=A0A7S2YG44_9STRA